LEKLDRFKFVLFTLITYSHFYFNKLNYSHFSTQLLLPINIKTYTFHMLFCASSIKIIYLYSKKWFLLTTYQYSLY